MPELAPMTTGLGEIYQYILKTKPGFEYKFDIMELRTIQDWICEIFPIEGTLGTGENVVVKGAFELLGLLKNKQE